MAFRQIDNMLNMIQYQLKAFTKYEVRLIKHPSKNGVSESITDLIFTDKELYRYQKKNENQKMSIFFRPQSPNFLMIDLDSKKHNLATAKGLKESGVLDYNPFMIIETSKLKFQVWYYCKDIKNWDQYITVGKNISTILGGDISSIKSRQVGRLPDFYHLKDLKKPFLTKIVY